MIAAAHQRRAMEMDVFIDDRRRPLIETKFQWNTVLHVIMEVSESPRRSRSVQSHEIDVDYDGREILEAHWRDAKDADADRELCDNSGTDRAVGPGGARFGHQLAWQPHHPARSHPAAPGGP